MDNASVNAHRAAPARVEQPMNPGHRSKRGSGRKKLIGISVGVVIIAAIVVVVVLMMYRSTVGSLIDSSKYQAIFLTNGQSYFGKLQPAGGTYMRLTDIYYLQTNTADATTKQTTTDSNAQVQLIKLGNEIHGPEDEMIIDKSQILFFENLKPDGKVSQSIAAAQKS